jgi:wyosine [tRNA(Phe)-imidazoG37] synthetase (radical SAM superfamily)
LAGIAQLRREYQGYLAIQTMVLFPWTPNMVRDYIQNIQSLHPNEVQLNIPSRPRVMVRHLDARGNDITASQPDALLNLKCVNVEILASLAAQIHDATQIPVRYTATASL